MEKNQSANSSTDHVSVALLLRKLKESVDKTRHIMVEGDEKPDELTFVARANLGSEEPAHMPPAQPSSLSCESHCRGR